MREFTGVSSATVAEMKRNATAARDFWYPRAMFLLVYFLCTILSVWGGCLVARVVANRLELGLFRRRVRSPAGDQPPAGVPMPRRRSGWWMVAAVLAMALGGGVAFVAHGASNLTGPMFERGWGESARFAGTIASLGLSGGLALVGFRFDPALGRRRCPKCWYDLSGTKGLLCPECGHEAGSERRLYRTRRSRITIAIAVLPLLVVPVVMRVMYAWKVGWVGLVPTTVMVVAWDVLPESVVGSPMVWWGGPQRERGTLFERIEDRHVAGWQRWIAGWKSASVIESSTDSRIVLRGLMLRDDGDGPTGAELLWKRSAFLVAELGSSDYTRSQAAVAIVQYLDQGGTGNYNPAVAAHKDVLIGLVLGADDQAATAALMLLRDGACLELLDEGQIASLQAILENPSSSVQRLYNTIVCLQRQGTTSPAALAMLVRLFDAANPKVRAQLVHSVLTYYDDPAILERAERAVRSDMPDMAAVAAGTRYWMRQQTVPSGIRAALIERVATDLTAAPKLWTVVREVQVREGLTPEELGKIRPSMTSTLDRMAEADIAQVLGLIAEANDAHPDTIAALERFIEGTDPKSPNLTIARDLRERLIKASAPK